MSPSYELLIQGSALIALVSAKNRDREIILRA